MKSWKYSVLWLYRVLLSLSIVAAGICLAAQCLLIYRSGPQPFSPERVALAFGQIALPVYLCACMVLLGLLLKPWLPVPGKNTEKNYEFILSRLEASVNLELCPDSLRLGVTKLNIRKRLIYILGWNILLISSIVFLLFGARPENFDPMAINSSMINAMHWLIPCMALPFFYSLFAVYYRRSIVQKQITLLRTAPAEAKCAAASQKAPSRNANWLRWTILAAAAALIVGGYLMDGAVDVLTKAVNICTECIGLG